MGRGFCVSLEGHTRFASSWGVGVLSLMAVEYKGSESCSPVTCSNLPSLHVLSSSHPGMLTAAVGRHAPPVFNDFPGSSGIQDEVSFGC